MAYNKTSEIFTTNGSTGYVGVGLTTPLAPLHLSLSTIDVQMQLIDYYFAGASNPTRILMRKARGTAASPADVSGSDVIGSIKHQARVSGVYVDIFEMFTTIGADSASTRVDFKWRHPNTSFPTFMSISQDLVLTFINSTTGISNGSKFFTLNPLANGTSINGIPFYWKKLSGSIASLEIGDDGAGHGILYLADSALPGSRKMLLGYFTDDGTASKFQISSYPGSAVASSSAWTGNATDANTWTFRRYRGSIGSNTTVQNGDYIAKFVFQGFSSTTNLREGASIAAVVDGAPSGDNVPMKLVIATRDTSPTLAERHAFHASGAVSFGSVTDDGFGARVQITGGLKYNDFLVDGKTTRVTSGTNTTASTTVRNLILAGTFTGDVTLRTPITTSDVIRIKNRTASSITVTPASGNIDGAANATVVAGAYIEVLYDGTEWVIV